MAIETERSRGDRSDVGPEARGERREGTSRSPDTSRPADTGADPAAIEAARARAIVRAAERISSKEKSDLEILSEESIVNKNRKVAVAILGASIGLSTASTAAVMLGFGKGLAVGSLGVVGAYTAWKLKWQSLSVVDWFARKMDSWGDKLIDKKIPVLSWVINPFVSFLDQSAKALGLDKSLAEHLKKNKEDRKKVAEKVFKDYMATQAKTEQKVDDAAAKAKRRKVLEAKLGPDVAAAIEDDVDDAAAAAAASSKAEPPAPAAVPAETAKAT